MKKKTITLFLVLTVFSMSFAQSQPATERTIEEEMHPVLKKVISELNEHYLDEENQITIENVQATYKVEVKMGNEILTPIKKEICIKYGQDQNGESTDWVQSSVVLHYQTDKMLGRALPQLQIRTHKNVWDMDAIDVDIYSEDYWLLKEYNSILGCGWFHHHLLSTYDGKEWRELRKEKRLDYIVSPKL